MDENLDGRTMWTTTGVTAKGKGFVHLHWGELSGQFTPNEARMFGLGLINAADSAEYDSALVHTLLEAELDKNQIGFILNTVRQKRDTSEEEGHDISQVGKTKTGKTRYPE